MSTTNETTAAGAAATPLTRDVVNLGRYYLRRAVDRARPYLGGRRGLILLAVAILGAGAALNWSWLVAVGMAPVLLALAPCAAMCALGLCMKGDGKACSLHDQSAKGSPGPAVSTAPRDEA